MTQKVQKDKSVCRHLVPWRGQWSKFGGIILYSSPNTIRIITATGIRLRPRSTRDYKKCVCL